MIILKDFVIVEGFEDGNEMLRLFETSRTDMEESISMDWNRQKRLAISSLQTLLKG